MRVERLLHLQTFRCHCSKRGKIWDEVGARLGLRVGGVALRGVVDDSWRLKVKEKERG